MIIWGMVADFALKTINGRNKNRGYSKLESKNVQQLCMYIALEENEPKKINTQSKCWK